MSMARNTSAPLALGNALRGHWIEFTLIMLGVAALYAPVVNRMVAAWMQYDDYSHGFLVPLVSAYFLYCRRAGLRDAEMRPAWVGLGVLALGLAQLLAGSLAGEYFTQRTSLLVVLAGLVLLLLGWQALRLSLPPLAYLVFMVPIPEIVYNSVAFPLKLMVTNLSVASLKLLDVAVLQEGNILIFPNVTLEVADACSGLRSLVSLAALGTAYAFIQPFPGWARLLLMVATVPIAVATNALRVVCTGLLAQHMGPEAAEGFLHEFAGLFVFAMAMLMVLGLGVLLRRVRS